MIRISFSTQATLDVAKAIVGGHCGPRDVGLFFWVREQKELSRGTVRFVCRDLGNTVVVTAYSYEGLVLDTFEKNFSGDSDFYAVVWNDRDGRCEAVEYASTRFGGGGTAEVDATPEVLERAKKWYAEEWQRRQLDAARRDAARIMRGKTVRVVKPYRPRGDNLPAEVGDVGEVFWVGESRFGARAGIRFIGGEKDGQKTFMPIDKVEVEDVNAHFDPGAIRLSSVRFASLF